MLTRSPRPPRPDDRRGFEIAIICALPLEADAIELLFDHHWDGDGLPFKKAACDPNAYSTGVIGCYNVVLVRMLGIGKVHAAVAASNCKASFPNVKIAFVVGVCGVVPFKRNGEEILLGDVVISEGIVQYDFGRRLPGRFVSKDGLLDSLGRPNQDIRGVLAQVKGIKGRQRLISEMTRYLNILRKKPELHAEYPGPAYDKLFEASYRHSEEQKSCEQVGCDDKLVTRRRLQVTELIPAPAVHFGLIASGDSVMKSGEDRDREFEARDVVAFEMEGAGVWDILPCIIIKGACDYADSHKSKGWQQYAAATAAACTKAFLNYWVSSFDQDVNFESSLSLQSQDSPYQNETAHAVDKRQMEPVFVVPFSKNSLFVGRHDILERLQGLLFEEGRQKIALIGLGGIGKTQVALQLAYWVKMNKQDYSVFWVPALSHASFEHACMEIIYACSIPTADSDNAIKAVRQYLSSKRAGKWFLVVDNADDAQTVMGSMGAESGIYRSLPQSDKGRILFTTRYRKVAVSVAGRNILDVPAMSQGEARSYLKEALIREISLDDPVANHLLTILTHLPLAITQAAAYINENQISLTRYVQLFENTDRDRIELLSAEFQDDTRYEQSKNPVATTWFISFNQIRKADELASRILMFLACVEPKAVPQSMLPKGESQQQLTRSIGILCGYRFLVTVEEKTLAENHPSRLASEQELAIAYQVNGHIAKAVELLEHVVKVQETTLAENHPSRLASQHALAGAYEANGQITEAVELLEHVVAVEATTLVENHPSRLASQHVLARAYQVNGHIEKAVELLEHVVKVQETTLAENHPSRLASQHELARAYQANGQITEAVNLLEHVVAIRETMLAVNHPDRLASQHELARTYQANGRITEAVNLVGNVVAIRKTTLAEDHPDRLASQHELAGVYEANGQITEAVELLEHVVTIRKTTLAKNHPSLLASQHALAMAYEANGQIEIAKITHHDSHHSTRLQEHMKQTGRSQKQ
ncbi:Nephrocystin-3 [Fusarium oxysporum f. sp. rapae]|uniref:Nephrocystin-3 n=1 Tax=Fusarium oxysporum f. sp. rapae TaxID=485398 RepID=A0A8J5TSI3_FUSOX|nr:Nephrocystin-3 [Fusarium oxysporum f. sp. rapae]